MVQSIVEQKEGPDLYLKEEVDRNWHEIALGNYTFNRLSLEVDELKDLQLLEFKRWACHVIRSGRRKLSVQIVGTGKEAQSESRPISEPKSSNQMNFTFYVPRKVCDKKSNYINNIEQFKEKLPLNPIHQTTE